MKKKFAQKAIKAVDVQKEFDWVIVDIEHQIKEKNAAEIFERFSAALCDFLKCDETPEDPYNAFAEAAANYYNTVPGICDIDSIRPLLPKALKLFLNGNKPDAA